MNLTFDSAETCFLSLCKSLIIRILFSTGWILWVVWLKRPCKDVVGCWMQVVWWNAQQIAWWEIVFCFCEPYKVHSKTSKANIFRLQATLRWYLIFKTDRLVNLFKQTRDKPEIPIWKFQDSFHHGGWNCKWYSPKPPIHWSWLSREAKPNPSLFSSFVYLCVCIQQESHWNE